jgi:taurine dioxygenase
VLFFREQAHLDDDGQASLVEALGKGFVHPTLPRGVLGSVDGAVAAQRANVWHSDVTFIPEYSGLSVLRAVTVPKVGGDTMWANCVTAYSDLPTSLRLLADGLWAIHSNDFEHIRDRVRLQESEEEYGKMYTSTLFETEHPVVRVIPENGERALVLGSYVKRLADLTTRESQQILTVLQSYVSRPENTVRWRWQSADVAIYDNRMTQHYALDDYGDNPRLMRTARAVGDAPVGIDGRRSRSRIMPPRSPA